MTDLPLETWDRIEARSAAIRHRIARDTGPLQSQVMSDDTPDAEPVDPDAPADPDDTDDDL